MTTQGLNTLIDQAVNPLGGEPKIKGPDLNKLLKSLAAEFNAVSDNAPSWVSLSAAIEAQRARLDTLVANAPQALDTLAEVAALLAADEVNAASILATQQQHTQQLANEVVHRTGDETIAGHKSFSEALGIGTTNPSQQLHLVDGVSEMRLGSGCAALTPTVALLNQQGKAAALIAGTTGAAVYFDKTGPFTIAATDHASFTNNNVSCDPSVTGLTMHGDGNVELGFNLQVAGQVKATAFIGDGSRLTGIPQPEIDKKYVDQQDQAVQAAILNEKGAPGGIAKLDTNGKILLSELPDALIGQVHYKGLYDFAANSISSGDDTLAKQTLPTSTASTLGWYFIVTTPGSLNSIEFQAGDWLISNGNDGWNKVDNTDAVMSVAGRKGNVTLTKEDVGLPTADNLPEGSSNTYFSASKVLATTLAGYVKAATNRAVAAGDSILVALGVLEKRIDDAGATNPFALGSDSNSFYAKNSATANAITAGYATSTAVLSGSGNTAGSPATVIAGGKTNTIAKAASGTANGSNTISGGSTNTIAAVDYATVAGGYQNTVSGAGGAVGGGTTNKATASSAVVGGGNGNTASGNYSVVGGGNGNTASDTYATVAGGNANTAGSTWAFVGGGYNNKTSGLRSSIVGGLFNTIDTGNNQAFIGSGYSNRISSKGSYSSILNGDSHVIDGPNSTIINGSSNTINASSCIAIGGNYVTISSPNSATLNTNSINIPSGLSGITVIGPVSTTIPANTPANSTFIDGKLTSIRLSYRGDFAASTAYTPNDVLSFNNKFYVVLTAFIAGSTFDYTKVKSLAGDDTVTPSAIKNAVTSGSYTNGELATAQPAGSIPGMKFCDATYRYEYMNGSADTNGTSFVWVRLLKA